MDIKLLIALLPFVFMLHDFEEIIMFVPWLEKNRDEVKRRFPQIDKVLSSHHDHLSTSAFAVAVLHEFLIIALITYISLYFNSYSWWFGAFAAFSLHLFVHIGQWIIFRKYVPFIVTSILALPYCILVFIEFLKVTDMTTGQLSLWSGIGIILTLASFVPAFFLAGQFEKWKNRKYLT
jgi:ABC-type proline/glycine betaine transport system permease subunit